MPQGGERSHRLLNQLLTIFPSEILIDFAQWLFYPRKKVVFSIPFSSFQLKVRTTPIVLPDYDPNNYRVKQIRNLLRIDK